MLKLLDYLRSLLSGGGLMIRLKGEEREGGYLFISSPDLKGFSLLLDPGKYDDLDSFIHAVNPSLTMYLEAYQSARNAAHSERLHLTSANKDGPVSARLCFE